MIRVLLGLYCEQVPTKQEHSNRFAFTVGKFLSYIFFLQVLTSTFLLLLIYGVLLVCRVLNCCFGKVNVSLVTMPNFIP